MTNDTNVVCQTIYYPLALYREYCGTRSVPSKIACSSLAGTEHIPVLDAASSVDPTGRTLSIAVVNRSATKQIYN